MNKIFKRTTIFLLSLLLLSLSNMVFADSSSDFERVIKQSYLEKIYSNNTDEPKIRYENAHEKIDYKYSNILMDKVEEFKANKPEATDDEINAYFMEIVNIYNSKNPNILPHNETTDSSWGINATGDLIYEIIDGQCNLNSHEREILEEKPYKGFQACIAGKEAQDWTLHKFGYNGHNDKSDAFRHSAWNIWIIGFTDDADFAKEWTDAHEIGATNQPPIEFNMDINNNRVGREFAEEYDISPNSSVNTTREAIEEAYFSGDLQYIPASTGVRTNFTGSQSDFVN